MPSIKRAVKSTEKKTGFEAYDGPEPLKRAVYRAKVKQINFKEFNSGAQGFVILLELEAAKGDPKGHKQFDGYPIWTNLVLGDKEAMLARESNLYAAFGAKDEPAIVFDDGDLKGGVKVTSIGGKKTLIDTVVNADMKPVMYNDQLRPEVDGIYKFKEDGIKPAFPSAAEQTEPESDDEESEDDIDVEVEVEETEDDEDGPSQEELDRTDEINAMKIGEIRTLAKSLDIDTAGLKKAELVDAILDEEFGEPEDGAPMATADDEDDEEDESEEEEEAEDDEEEDDEEEEEEEEDLDASAEDTRKAELAELARTELKSILKSINPEFKVFKTTTDDALRDAIIAAEYGSETPF